MIPVTGSPEQLRSTEVMSDAGSPVTFREEERLEASLAGMNREEEAESLKYTDWSQEIERVEEQRIGDGNLVSRLKSGRLRTLACGTVWMKKEEIIIRGKGDEVQWKLKIQDEKFRKEMVEERAGRYSITYPGVCWSEVSTGQRLAIITSLHGDNTIRDNIYEYITEVQKGRLEDGKQGFNKTGGREAEKDEQELGFGLFD